MKIEVASVIKITIIKIRTVVNISIVHNRTSLATNLAQVANQSMMALAEANI